MCLGNLRHGGRYCTPKRCRIRGLSIMLICTSQLGFFGGITSRILAPPFSQLWQPIYASEASVGQGTGV